MGATAKTRKRTGNFVVPNGARYAGQYVVVCGPSSDRRVVSASRSAIKAYKEALKMDCQDPLLVYVPPKKRSA